VAISDPQRERLTTIETDIAARLDAVLGAIASGAGGRDRLPVPAPFPEDAIGALEAVGVLAWDATPGPERPAAADELGLVRAVARADASVGRIFDGHLNGVERLAVQAPVDLRDRELAMIRAGGLRVGVWARRDLELFLVQHRLDPGLAAAGARALDKQGRKQR